MTEEDIVGKATTIGLEAKAEEDLAVEGLAAGQGEMIEVDLEEEGEMIKLVLEQDEVMIVETRQNQEMAIEVEEVVEEAAREVVVEDLHGLDSVEDDRKSLFEFLFKKVFAF